MITGELKTKKRPLGNLLDRRYCLNAALREKPRPGGVGACEYRLPEIQQTYPYRQHRHNCKKSLRRLRNKSKSKLTMQQSLDKLEVLKKPLMQEYFG